MSEIEKKTRGYVYILEVKDIYLPICKIGMTTRTPYERCDEINNNSTGDFIWEVAHYIAVDDCKKLESLVHSKLAPLRQKRREFFSLNADDANTAINSIVESQTEIKEVKAEEIIATKDDSSSTKKKVKRKKDFERIDAEYAELLQLFTSLLNVQGRPFGQLNRPLFGVSDGNEGVQWNLSVSTDTGIIRLGVNLEGMKYNNWPITTFIQSEMNNSKIEQVGAKVGNPEEVYLRFCRDAWQITSRPAIVEKYLGGRECPFSDIDSKQWALTLTEALACLNRDANYRARAKQTVTLQNKPKKGEQVRVMEVSPHLTVWSPVSLDGDKQGNIQRKIAELQPVYNWVKRVSQS